MFAALSVAGIFNTVPMFRVKDRGSNATLSEPSVVPKGYLVQSVAFISQDIAVGSVLFTIVFGDILDHRK